MIGHLGTRASALLDGQLPAAEAERLWAHVHGCHLCRDLVEREGWIKTRLSGLGGESGAPDHLKGALLCGPHPVGAGWGVPPGDVYLALGERPVSRARRAGGIAATVGSAAGVAVMGVLALGTSPADAPTVDRRAPVANLNVPTYSPTFAPARRQSMR